MEPRKQEFSLVQQVEHKKTKVFFGKKNQNGKTFRKRTFLRKKTFRKRKKNKIWKIKNEKSFSLMKRKLRKIEGKMKKRRKFMGLAAAVFLAMPGQTTSYLPIDVRLNKLNNAEITIVVQDTSNISQKEEYAEAPKKSNNISDYSKEVTDAAKKFHLSESLIRKIILAESSGNHDSYSPKGAIGFMQLMPETADDMNVNPYNPEQNIYGGAKYLRILITKYDGDLRKVLAAYNWGPSNVDSSIANHGGEWLSYREKTNQPRKWIVPAETRNYIQKVLGSENF